MTSHQPLVSIIALHWNTTEVTCEFLRSINEQNSYKNIEVLVVDNCSSNDDSALFKSIYPEATIIRTDRNLGFSGGNNVGIRAAKGDYLFIVNNDTEFTPGLIKGLVDTFAEYGDAGVVSPKFHYFYAKGTIEYAGYKSVNVFTGRNEMVGCREKDQGQYDQPSETNYAHGGGMMVSRKAINDAGIMHEPYFLYYEEFDWCNQIKKKGYKVYYQPKSLIYHKESMTTGKSSPLKTFYITRNRILFMRRNAPLYGLLIFLAYFVCFTIPKNTMQFLVKKKKDHLQSFWKGILWHLNSKINFN